MATGVNSNCHILAIGSQECEKSIEKSLVFPSKEEWERRLLLEVQEDYILIKTETLGATHLAIFTHRSFEKYIKGRLERIAPQEQGICGFNEWRVLISYLLCLDSDSSRIATGIGNMLGNKGSIAISVYLEQTDILFVNSHFSGTNMISNKTNICFF